MKQPASERPSHPAREDSTTRQHRDEPPDTDVSEEYRKYRDAELEEKKRLERYERTMSTDTEQPVSDRDGETEE